MPAAAEGPRQHPPDLGDDRGMRAALGFLRDERAVEQFQALAPEHAEVHEALVLDSAPAPGPHVWFGHQGHGRHAIGPGGSPGGRWGPRSIVPTRATPDAGPMTTQTLPETQPAHSAAWVTQTYISFAVSLSAFGIGIAYLPVDAWMRAFLAVAGLYAVTSAISLSKTMRDQHEARQVVARVDEAKLEKLLTDRDPYKVSSF